MNYSVVARVGGQILFFFVEACLIIDSGSARWTGICVVGIFVFVSVFALIFAFIGWRWPAVAVIYWLFLKTETLFVDGWLIFFGEYSRTTQNINCETLEIIESHFPVLVNI